MPENTTIFTEEFHNTNGQQTIHWRIGQTMGSCTVISADPVDTPPGETSLIKFKIDLSCHQGNIAPAP